MGFSRQKYWSGLPCPPPGDLPEPRDRAQVSHIAGGPLLSEPTGKSIYIYVYTHTHTHIYIMLYFKKRKKGYTYVCMSENHPLWKSLKCGGECSHFYLCVCRMDSFSQDHRLPSLRGLASVISGPSQQPSALPGPLRSLRSAQHLTILHLSSSEPVALPCLLLTLYLPPALSCQETQGLVLGPQPSPPRLPERPQPFCQRLLHLCFCPPQSAW